MAKDPDAAEWEPDLNDAPEWVQELFAIMREDDLEQLQEWKNRNQDINPEWIQVVVGCFINFNAFKIGKYIVDTYHSTTFDEGNTMWHFALNSDGGTNVWFPLLKERAEADSTFQPWNQINDEGETLLNTAVHNDHLEVVRWLLQRAPHLIDVPDKTGYTPLHYIIDPINRRQAMPILISLVEAGSRAWESSMLGGPHGWTAIEHCSHYDNEEAFFYLLSLGMGQVDSFLAEMQKKFGLKSGEGVRGFEFDTFYACSSDEELEQLGKTVDFTRWIFEVRAKPINNSMIHHKYQSLEKTIDIRFRLYFARSLTYRLLLQIR